MKKEDRGTIHRPGDSRDLVEEFVESHEVAVVAFLGNEHKEERRIFNTASYHSQNGENSIPFAIAPARLASVFATDDEGGDPPAAPTVLLFKKFDEGKVRYLGQGGDPRKSWLSEALRLFAKSHSLPLVIPFSEEMAPRIFGGERHTHFLAFCDAENEPDIVDTLSQAARAYRGDMLFVTIGKESARIRNFFDVSEEDFPTARLVVMGGDTLRKYRFAVQSKEDGGASVDGTASLSSLAHVSSFIQRFKAGELSPDLKSEEPPEPNDGPVTIVVGKTFDEFVLDETRDVLVQFYAPWCGHCKRLAPVWEELGMMMTDVESVRIAKMDATANEHEEVDVAGFPTIMLWPAKGGAGSDSSGTGGLEYDGAREIAGFLEFQRTRCDSVHTTREVE